MDMVPFTEGAIREYLDNAIRNWRKIRDEELDDPEARHRAACYVDAFQSVRSSFFGVILDEETT